MPIYVARWPDLSLSIVEADNQREMLSSLDEIAEPNAVNFKKLEKPLFLSLKVDQEDKDVIKETFNLGKAMIEDEEFCDTSFVIENTEVKCHKAIFASRCRYFRDLFMNKPHDKKIFLKDTSLSVFLLVKEYIYTDRIRWPTPVEFKFLLDVFKYTKAIGGLNVVMDGAKSQIENKIYFMEPKDLVYGYRTTEHICEDLNTNFKKKLLQHLREGKEKKETKSSNIIKKLDLTLHEMLLSDIDKEMIVKDKLKSFRAILYNFKGKNFVSKACQYIDENFCDEMFNESHNPYFALVSRCVGECTPHVKKQCICLINTLSKYNFDVDKKERVFGHGVCYDRSPLFLAALNGMFDFVKALVNVGADILQRIRPNGQTLLHVIEIKINESESGLGEVISILSREEKLCNIGNVKHVFDWLMSRKGYKDISQVPFHDAEKKLTIGRKYAKQLMTGFLASEVSVPFHIEEAQSDGGSECHRELSEMLHPRVSEIASKVDELSYPDDDEELTKRVVDAAKADWMDATRVFHPDPRCKKMIDDNYTDDESDSMDSMDEMDEMGTDLISRLLNINRMNAR